MNWFRTKQGTNLISKWSWPHLILTKATKINFTELNRATRGVEERFKGDKNSTGAFQAPYPTKIRIMVSQLNIYNFAARIVRSYQMISWLWLASQNYACVLYCMCTCVCMITFLRGRRLFTYTTIIQPNIICDTNSIVSNM